jgi:hypothetical protein
MREILKLTTAGFMGAVIALGLAAKSSPVQDEVTAKKITLVDGSGKPIGIWQAEKDGQAGLRLFRPGAEETPALYLGLINGGDGAWIALEDRQQKNQLTLSAAPEVSLVDVRGAKSRVWMRSDKDSSIFIDHDQQTRVKLSGTESMGWLQVSGPKLRTEVFEPK